MAIKYVAITHRLWHIRNTQYSNEKYVRRVDLPATSIEARRIRFDTWEEGLVRRCLGGDMARQFLYFNRRYGSQKQKKRRRHDSSYADAGVALDRYSIGASLFGNAQYWKVLQDSWSRRW